MSKITLYEVNDLYQRALDEADTIAEQHEGVIPDDLAMKLDGLEMAREMKIENTVKFAKNLQAEYDAVEAEHKRLGARLSSLDRRIEWIKAYLGMVVGAGNKMTFAAGKISWRESTSTEIVDATAIPAKYKTERVEVDISKKAIKADIEAGIDVPGAELKKKQNLQLK